MQPVTPVDIVGGLGVLGLFSRIIMSGAAEIILTLLAAFTQPCCPRLCSLNYEKEYNESRRQKKASLPLRSPVFPTFVLTVSKPDLALPSCHLTMMPNSRAKKRSLSSIKLLGFGLQPGRFSAVFRPPG
ncbi:hypothetical protein ES703_81531 [subsurface metagenome]